MSDDRQLQFSDLEDAAVIAWTIAQIMDIDPAGADYTIKDSLGRKHSLQNFAADIENHLSAFIRTQVAPSHKPIAQTYSTFGRVSASAFPDSSGVHADCFL